ncbi:MAG: glycoside hydrolase family 116 protein, partial [Bryobacteraceae bacterium]|nr:glycoside hydrolase family 116 protein [Bryobacteraceae bacterium]
EKHEKAGKYQYGNGCLSDQLLGQWFAEVVNLGKLLPHEHIRTALASIFKYNFCSDLGDFANVQRVYAMDQEKGLLLCSWPRGGRPLLPFVYSDEVWTGIEYQVAAHLMYEGMIKEGVAIVDAVRDRYDGVRRNPWNEIECGHHYARAMASWSLLLALSGFAWSAPSRSLRFRPRVSPNNFRCFFCAGVAWGTYAQRRLAEETVAEVAVKEGRLEIAELRLPYRGANGRITASLPAESSVRAGEAILRFPKLARL